ncbi:MAG TPA: NAD(P)-binding domain-containing protein, partial [Xanthobacteraceae bacterium]
MPNIGFIGLGNMGAPMAANLLKSGDHVVGFDVIAAARQASAQSGVEIASSAKQSVEGADIVIT